MQLTHLTRRPIVGRRRQLQVFTAGLMAAAGLALAPPALAHEGGPYPVFERSSVGPYTVSVWADPHVGVSQVLVQVVEPAGATSNVHLIATPLDGHRSGHDVPAKQNPSARGIATDTWSADLPVDATGTWSLSITIQGAIGSGQVAVPLEVAPEGPSLTETGIFTLPFVLLGGALLLGYLRHGRRPRMALAA